jgi:hypothetical protein
MRSSFLLLAFAATAITSCTAAYKTGQTPDDIYFSPQRPTAEYVNVKDKEEDPGYYNGNDYYGDRYLHMKVQNRYMWSDLNDYYYNDRYAYGFGGYSYYNSLYGYNPWSPVSYWNYYYNPYYSSFYYPYYSPVIMIGGKYNTNYNYAVTNRPRMSNLNTYNNNNLLNNSNYTSRRFDFNSSPSGVDARQYQYNNNYRNSRTGAGNFLRNAMGNNNNYNNSNDNSRSFNNSNSGSGGRSSGGGGGSSSGGGGSAPVRRF